MVAIPPDFFETTGMRLLAGRGFLPSDGPGGPYVSIVNRSLANALWPGEDPLGRCFIYGEKTNPCVTVVGVVDDLRPWRVTDEPTPLYFVPLTQRVGSPNPWTPGVLVVRAAPGRQEDVATLLRQELARAFPTAQPSVRPLAQALHDQYRPWRLGALLFSAFAILALVVAAIGVYGVVSYVFSQRTHELGVRMALGARRGDVLGLVVSSGLRQVGVGVVLGLAGALAAGRLVESLLYGISARDPVSLVAAPVALLLVGIAATLPAAWRAMRVDPVTVLRDE
ncbi:MAG TPA: FtsX-like permease family protein, partial [Gemmatimonadaceae bacterium]